ncbi:MAG: hypothetical protein KC656_20025, partial [Myxococcales bacterium]|nr:hypothetical protein [Myxococcales bacterium]
LSGDAMRPSLVAILVVACAHPVIPRPRVEVPPPMFGGDHVVFELPSRPPFGTTGTQVALRIARPLPALDPAGTCTCDRADLACVPTADGWSVELTLARAEAWPLRSGAIATCTDGTHDTPVAVDLVERSHAPDLPVAPPPWWRGTDLVVPVPYTQAGATRAHFHVPADVTGLRTLSSQSAPLTAAEVRSGRSAQQEADGITCELQEGGFVLVEIRARSGPPLERAPCARWDGGGVDVVTARYTARPWYEGALVAPTARP